MALYDDFAKQTGSFIPARSASVQRIWGEDSFYAPFTQTSTAGQSTGYRPPQAAGEKKKKTVAERIAELDRYEQRPLRPGERRRAGRRDHSMFSGGAYNPVAPNTITVTPGSSASSTQDVIGELVGNHRGEVDSANAATEQDRQQMLGALNEFKQQIRGNRDAMIGQVISGERANMGEILRNAREQFANAGGLSAPYAMANLAQRLAAQSEGRILAARQQIDQAANSQENQYIQGLLQTYGMTDRQVSSQSELLAAIQAISQGGGASGGGGLSVTVGGGGSNKTPFLGYRPPQDAETTFQQLKKLWS